MSELTHDDLEAADRKNQTAQELQRVALISSLKPTLSVDGNQWCFLYGDNLQEGVAGFGDTPNLAMMDFNYNWYNQTIQQSDKSGANENV